MDITYDIHTVRNKDGAIKWGVFENHWLLDVFDTKEQAQRYLDAWRKVMR